MEFPRTFLIDGSVDYVAPSQVLRSRSIRILLRELLNECVKDDSCSKFVERIIGKSMEKGLTDSDLDKLIRFFASLITGVADSNYDREGAEKFVEKLYNAWRDKHRFMVLLRKYESFVLKRMYLEYKLARTADIFSSLVRSMYRELLYHINESSGRVLRQLPSGVQAAFLVDFLPLSEKLGYHVPFVWSAVLYPPVIFHTWANKREGIFPLKEGRVINKLKLHEGEWLGIPIKVGKLKMLVYTHKEFLAMLTGLINLFKIADFEDFEDEKVDGIVFFGVDKSFIKPGEERGVVYYDVDTNVYVGLIPNFAKNDYFGYMKKMILTVHNLVQIDRGNLPLHGAVARIVLKDGTEKILALVGDSGAGKSETLEALNRINANSLKEVEMIVDDMATLQITHEGVVAYGTEIGAFVRLDDLPRHYAYATMDRSIFMNPGIVNSRVIVPFANYERIVKPWKIDYLLYANNYQRVRDSKEIVVKFGSVDEALRVFSEGKRMAKSTTHERGLTRSYFANPFGAVQKRDVHEVIARKFFEQLFAKRVFVGELRTQLGVAGMEEEGPRIAAEALIKLLCAREVSQKV